MFIPVASEYKNRKKQERKKTNATAVGVGRQESSSK